ncbi:MAG: pyruvate:ferredoxin (flavodoxin) oxidoreductase [Candidatus Thiodiazotropha sp. (ex Ctena orbiculata)]|uniref:Pyruvate-flavodoxin oxidoreductase n=1 Tax=Candidatus Thiodiazotropha taylori TaxID=2792791 RepID=A0A944M8X0_9GAMM|nr:pyruvate:ferredoxin (flavodoxin) oxidoreductase [Candidatus Thiodiazotropha taylori]PUB83633.1 MAG: pyruvate:ferredoxin (flavodoxin) oxidoreductase [gamma proteobacterium symbiont of Ctena orbiculata]MBT2988374.1 pyruvate:ferredoxin (flavodoxin) oxidoreductase [Candidatus Thiodiazotropha taylori]MBT2997281.1 pyruvate:ferredoxin (flavodoxin) oxidoreductase [Candidatus Thiodiazotropha taylori]MBT3001009.1 pyruvate:ferredoxin (flavodoxin) oxidoreductase [Candidatus Thiodiazotropha taylori]
MQENMVTIDGNEAAAHIAHLTNEVIAIYPITPASPMGEWSDEWSARGVTNIWGTVPDVIEMQSEAGAAGTVHGALQAGSLSTSFTASQGLLLMIPNMYKIAGELTPTVLHVSARSLAVQALSIFGDHSDVMACRATGYAMLCSASVQEVADFALIAQAASLESRVPYLHFFDGFRTSHEVNKIQLPSEETIKAMINEEWISAHRERSLSPDRPVIRGTSQNPDVYFQGRETVNPFYDAAPAILQGAMDRFARLSGRQYALFEYLGAEQPEHIIMLMGSGIGAAQEAVADLTAGGEKIGMVKVRLFRPFAAERLLEAVPDSVKKIAVLDRTKEPGADGEPLYKDVLGAFAQAYSDGRRAHLPRIIGGRYGLSSKEFTPAMVKGIFDELEKEQPRNPFTVGIIDDLSKTSLPWDSRFRPAASQGITACLFYGLGADGTVSANKNSIKIIGEQTENHAQGYFQYDSKKSGAITVSHLRFGPEPINSTYLIGADEASFVACHQPTFLGRYEMLDKAKPGGVFLLNTSATPDEVWETLPGRMQRQIIDKGLSLYLIDAYEIAEKTGMGRRINTIMQTCFFAISGLLEQDQAIELIKDAVKKSYGRKGARLLQRNYDAIDAALTGLHQVQVPEVVTRDESPKPVVPADAPIFVQQVTSLIIAGLGDAVPVSLMPNDGTWPVGTTAYEKRNIALQLPKWEMDLCTHCGKCPLVCPHAAIRSKLFPEALTEDAPDSFLHTQVKGAKDFEPDTHISYQVAPDDCTGCGLCVEICPIRDKQNPQRKALNMVDDEAYHRQERANWEFFLTLPEYDRTKLKETTIKGAMIMQPLFEFSGACVGCGETPYVKLATQLFGDRMLIANATGCSSIYGGNLPTTPYTTNPDGRGPTWSNSLFEDNAEFGLGMRIAIDMQRDQAVALLSGMRDQLGGELSDALIKAEQQNEAEIFEQRQRIETLKQKLAEIDNPEAGRLLAVADSLSKKSVWLVGGDGWAYDIGYGGVDHVLASGRNVNILLLDTETYSNTGGQTSKATPLGAVAKFSASGKPTNKKDIALMAMAYGNVYVGQVAFGAKDIHTLRIFLEAESYDGPSLIICYSPCIAHGVDLSNNIRQQELAVDSGHWPLFRYDPRRSERGENPLKMDSKEPSIPYRDFAGTETRFSVLERTHPALSERFLRQAQHHIRTRYQLYEQLAKLAVDEKEK